MYKVKANVESPLADGSLVYRIFFEVGFSTRTGVSGSVGGENVLEMKLPNAAKTYWMMEDAIMQLRLDIKTQPRKKEAIWGLVIHIRFLTRRSTLRSLTSLDGLIHRQSGPLGSEGWSYACQACPLAGIKNKRKQRITETFSRKWKTGSAKSEVMARKGVKGSLSGISVWTGGRPVWPFLIIRLTSGSTDEVDWEIRDNWWSQHRRSDFTLTTLIRLGHALLRRTISLAINATPRTELSPAFSLHRHGGDAQVLIDVNYSMMNETSHDHVIVTGC
jgi:hypothetical protein